MVPLYELCIVKSTTVTSTSTLQFLLLFAMEKLAESVLSGTRPQSQLPATFQVELAPACQLQIAAGAGALKVNTSAASSSPIRVGELRRVSVFKRRAVLGSPSDCFPRNSIRISPIKPPAARRIQGHFMVSLS